ncbi:MAG TPA: RCC1 domain-containing protein [Myxococcota bacterium]|nr:RCC1 domain-containing protein [Myxococcota bacterium]
MKGELACWGDSDWGVEDPPPGRFLELSISATFGCAIAEDHSLICWGGSPFPYPDDSFLEPPVGSFQQVSAGLYHACAITTDGQMECWGFNQAGEIEPPE